MSSYLVTGGGRGLGFQFVQLLSKKPTNEVSVVFATIRASISKDLQQVVHESQGRVVVVHLVPTDANSIARAVEMVKQELAGRGLDVLINNAGMMEVSESVELMNNLRQTLELNVESVHNITSALLPLLRQGIQKKVLNL
jgi:NAD(P)-dependent dehydrogenase (short-subunit alcohol dehydrogenase family)